MFKTALRKLFRIKSDERDEHFEMHSSEQTSEYNGLLASRRVSRVYKEMSTSNPMSTLTNEVHIALTNEVPIRQTNEVPIRQTNEVPTAEDVSLSPELIIALCVSAFNGSNEIIQKIIKREINVNVEDDLGRSPLMIACSVGHIPTVELLIMNGADVNHRHKKFGFTSLIIATKNGHVQAVQMLLKYGADVDIDDGFLVDALVVATLYRSTEIVEIFLQINSQNKKYHFLYATFIAAAQDGNTDILQLLLSYYTERYSDEFIAIEYALFLAIERGYDDKVKLLAERFDVNRKLDYEDWVFPDLDLITLGRKDRSDVDYELCDCEVSKCTSALALSSRNGNTIIINILLDHGADINDELSNGWTPLMIAVSFGHFDAVRLLISRGANVNHSNKNRNTAMLIASHHGHSEILELLLDNNADINVRLFDHVTGLMLATQKGYIKTVEVLIEYGSDVNSKNIDKWSALHIASYMGRTQINELLIASHCEVNKAEIDGWSALMLASQQSHFDCVQILLDNRAIVDFEEKHGWTSLFIAVCENSHDVVKLLLSRGAQVNHRNNEGWTALMFAAKNGSVEITNTLLQRNALVNLCNVNEDNALMLASSAGHVEVVEILLFHGALVNEHNKNGQNALTLAAAYNHREVVELLCQQNSEFDSTTPSRTVDVMPNLHKRVNQMLKDGPKRKGITPLVVDQKRTPKKKRATAIQMFNYNFNGKIEIVEALKSKNVSVTNANNVACDGGTIIVTNSQSSSSKQTTEESVDDEDDKFFS